ncbi:hypothetical protein GGI43DRAFT_429753 [Trichoderma evansii]
MDSLNTDSNGQAGSPVALDETCLPRGQGAGITSAINIGDPDATTFYYFEESFCQEPQQQQQQQQEDQKQQEDEQQQEQQLVLFNPTDADSLNQPYLPWDLPGFDQHLYPFPLPAMTDDQLYQSPSYYVDPNFFENDYTQQQQPQYDEYQSLQPWMSPAFEEAAVLDVQDIQNQVNELGELSFENSDGPFEPLSFEYAAMPDHLIQDPLLDERWAAAYEGHLFGHSQALGDTIRNETPFDENVVMKVQAASSPQAPTEVIPTEQEHQRHLPGDERPNHSYPQTQLIVAGNKAALERVRRKRLRKSPKPVVKVDWLPRDADRETKDRFLVESRRNQVSYKLIKTFGRFVEAESTLRGRFRTLTKRREDRVRDPKWTPIDIHLLKEAVQVYAGGQHPNRVGISWMMVSQYITGHGGTYAFGYTTCHRRWVHLEETGQLGENWADQSWETQDDEEDNEEDDEEDDDEMEGVETEANDEDDDDGDGYDNDEEDQYRHRS